MNEPQPFTPDFLQFYRELAANNDRDWFQANRKRYEESVRLPFETFVGGLIVRMNAADPAIDIQPKDAIFRINRDVRFSKDKAPYKLCSSAVIGRGGKKDTVSPGIYIELGPEKLAVYGGVYMPDKHQLAAIRNHIAGNLKKFADLLDEKGFRSTYGTLRGEQNKILPNELKQAAEQQPLLYNKAFYFYAHLPAEEVIRPGLSDKVMAVREAGVPMSSFLFEPLSGR
ncbi:MAG: DUF2461 domain-containing protein [Flavobacteriales bacterium]|nr:DUF2461 domain-containing protein [Flavobacteriales bacterium]